jgi:hypothetical protein
MDMMQTILGAFRQREAEIKLEGERRDREAATQLRESEARVKNIRAKLTAARLNYAAMIEGYRAVEAAEAAKAADKLRESETTLAKVSAGAASLKDFMEAGLTEDAIGKKAAGEAAGKLTAGLAVIRDQSRAILELEIDETEELLNISYAQAEPAKNQILKLRAECETLDRGVALVMEGRPQVYYTREEKKSGLMRANGKFLNGRTWEGLDLDALRALRFDCEIADAFMPDLERIIREVKPGQVVNVHLLSGMATLAGPRLEYSTAIPSGAPITTTTAGRHK